MLRNTRVYRTEAVAIKRFDYGEADKILTLYTPHHGKMSAIAKGVRRPKSRMSGHLDLFMHSTVLIAHGRNLDIVTQAQTIESFPRLRSDLWRGSYAHYVAELVDAFTPDRMANDAIYSSLLLALRRIDHLSDVRWAVRAFEMRLLGLSGYRPELHRCLHCSQAIAPQANRFSLAMGGVLCPSCGAIDLSAPSISVPALKLLRNLQTNEHAVVALESIDDATSREVERRMQEYIEYRLEKRPRSVQVLEAMKGI